MLKIKVELLAFEDGKTRMVNIPFEPRPEEILTWTYHYGQNDHQPLEMPSVSAGDIIHLDGHIHLILKIGFKEIDNAKYIEYKNLPRRERYKALKD